MRRSTAVFHYGIYIFAIRNIARNYLNKRRIISCGRVHKSLLPRKIRGPNVVQFTMVAEW